MSEPYDVVKHLGFCPECGKREWSSLTEKEVRDIWSSFNSGLDTAMNFYQAIEAKLKEKNT